MGDVVSFGELITQDDLIVHAIKGTDDLIIALKEDAKNFSEFWNDKIYLVHKLYKYEEKAA